MEDYQERVISEKRELDERWDKLIAFICSDRIASLPVDEQDRLKRQCKIMGEYSAVLDERISAFKV